MKAFIPNESHENVFDIDLAELHQNGFKIILIDVDNTITPWRSNVIGKDFKEWIDKCQDLGFSMYLFSNSSSSRISKLAEHLKISAIPKGGKPLTLAFRRALRYIDGEVKETVMIGDQIFTDILGGNLVGLYTILVNPISTKEFWGTKLNRFLEKILVGRG